MLWLYITEKEIQHHSLYFYLATKYKGAYLVALLSATIDRTIAINAGKWPGGCRALLCVFRLSLGTSPLLALFHHSLAPCSTSVYKPKPQMHS